jgi:hypothetical protein
VDQEPHLKVVMVEPLLQALVPAQEDQPVEAAQVPLEQALQ